MNLRYALVTSIAILLGIALLFLPEKKIQRETNPQDLLLAINDESRFLSCDELAHMIIQQDPYFLLIDVRPESDYLKYKLPGSLNIPVDSLLSPQFEPYLRQDGLKKIFYSNTTALASQAWVIAKRKVYPSIYVLDGGLDRWARTILDPIEPGATEPQEALDLYSFRKAASRYFGNSGNDAQEDIQLPKPTINSVNNKKAAQGGC